MATTGLAVKKQLKERRQEYSLTADEVAEILDYSKYTIFRWARAGRLPHWKAGRNLWFSPADVEAFTEKQVRGEEVKTA